MFVDGGFKIKIIIKDSRKKLGLLTSRPTPYTFKMAYQTLPNYIIGLIRDLKIHIHGIPYISTFTIMKINVLDVNYSMSLGSPWLCDVKVTHDWGSNMITIESNGIVWIVTITRHLDSTHDCKYFSTLSLSLELKVIKRMFYWS